MDFLSRYFTKRYILYFCLYFLLWYPASFFLWVANVVAQTTYMHIAFLSLQPMMLFLVSYLYFRKSTNTWNDRFLVAFGWLIATFLLAAVLVQPMYGFDWTSIINPDQLINAWSPFIAILFAGLLAGWMREKQIKKQALP